LWLVDAMRQARASVRGQQVPVVILHAAGARHTDDLVVLRLGDFVALYGELGPGRGTSEETPDDGR
jgi:hypothetical protein